MTGIGPLDGVRVLEVTNWMAAPSAGVILADMGADVVKIEPLSGDAVRGMMRQPKTPEGTPEIDYSFQVDNRGKRSIAVAINRPEGADLVRRLAIDADIFLCNLLPKRQAKYGLDAETLHSVNRRLVHATLTGYGLTGPDADRPGYDVTTFFGRGAITESMTDPDGVAPSPRPAQGDHATGLALVAGILAALRLVDRTGEGQTVDVSLLATAAWTMATDLSAAIIDGRQPSKRDRHHVVTPLANRYRCGDGRWVIFNMPEPHWWPRFCEAVEHKEWLDDPRFESFRDRYDRMPELVDLIDAALATKTLDQWAEIFDRAGLIWGPASTIAELARDPQAMAIDLFPEIDCAGRSVRTVAAPLHIRGADIRPRGPAPELGQHTSEVLLHAGIPAGEIAAFAAAGVVGPPSLAEITDVDVAEPI